MAGEFRLETNEPDLLEALRRASVEGQRRVAEAVAVHSIEIAGVSEEVLGDARAALREGQYGAEALIGRLDAVVDRLDETQWDLRDRFESGEVSEEQYLAAFGRARAVNALRFALETDPLVAAAEAVYEALAVTDDREDIRRVFDAAVRVSENREG